MSGERRTHTEFYVPRRRVLIEDTNGDVETGRSLSIWMTDRQTGDEVFWDGYIQWEPDSSTLIDSYVEIE